MAGLLQRHLRLADIAPKILKSQIGDLKPIDNIQIGVLGCWGATEQKTGLRKFQATSSMSSAGFLKGRNSPRVTASGTEKA